MSLSTTSPDAAWPAWVDGHTEMLFNRTDTDVPDLRASKTDPALLRRCAYVHLNVKVLRELTPS